MPSAHSYPTDARVAFQRHERVWLCLTTLHHRRFVEDAVHVIGLPFGSSIRLRYRKQYIDRDLWHEVSQGRVPNNTTALVVLGATSSSEENVVQPLREGRVIAARCEGSVLIIDLILRNFVLEALPTGTFWNELQIIAKNLPKAFGSRPGNEGSYLQELAVIPQAVSSGSSIQAWEAAAANFFRIDEVGAQEPGSYVPCAPFLFHIAKLPKHITARLEESGELKVEAGGSISLEVHTLAASSSGAFRNPLGEIFFDLSHPAAAFTSTRRVRVDSRRDVRPIRIATTPLFRRASGHLSVRTVVFEEDGQSQAPAPATVTQPRMLSAKKRGETVITRYDFPLRVGRWMPFLASTLVAAAAALAAYKPPAEGKSADALTYLIPTFTFAFAFLGLVIGLRREGKG